MKVLHHKKSNFQIIQVQILVDETYVHDAQSKTNIAVINGFRAVVLSHLLRHKLSYQFDIASRLVFFY